MASIDSIYEQIGRQYVLNYVAIGSGIGRLKPKNCKKGWNCGYSCQSKDKKNCRSALTGQARTYTDWLSAQAEKTQKTSKLFKKEDLPVSEEWPSRVVLQGNPFMGFQIVSGSEDFELAKQYYAVDPKKYETFPAFVKEETGLRMRLVDVQSVDAGENPKKNPPISSYLGEQEFPTTLVVRETAPNEYNIVKGRKDFDESFKLYKKDKKTHEMIPAYIQQSDKSLRFQLIDAVAVNR